MTGGRPHHRPWKPPQRPNPRTLPTIPGPCQRDAPAPWYRRWRSWLAAGLVVAVLGSASCQASGSVKHAGLCTRARANMDTAAKPETQTERNWDAVSAFVTVAEKVC